MKMETNIYFESEVSHYRTSMLERLLQQNVEGPLQQIFSFKKTFFSCLVKDFPAHVICVQFHYYIYIFIQSQQIVNFWC